MELPNYRLPTVKNVFQLLWEKTLDFLKRAFTVILLATVIIWFLGTFDFHFAMVGSSSDQSMLAIISGFLVPLFRPLGFGDHRIVTSLLSGFLAKESVVSTLEVLYGSTAALQATLNPVGALSLLVFCLLYTPCVAAIAAVRRELGRGYALGVVAGQCLIAWLAAGLVQVIGTLILHL